MPTPGCPDTVRLLGIFPNDSVVVYGCHFGPTFFEGSTDPVPGLAGGFDALGPSRTPYVNRQYLVSLAGGARRAPCR